MQKKCNLGMKESALLPIMCVIIAREKSIERMSNLNKMIEAPHQRVDENYNDQLN